MKVHLGQLDPALKFQTFKMGLFKSSKDSTPQNIEEVEEASEKSPDAISHEEKDTGTEAITRNQIVDPGVEKRLISKLDWNVVPLVFALCWCLCMLLRIVPNR